MLKVIKGIIRDICIILTIWLAVILIAVGFEVSGVASHEILNNYVRIFGCYFAGIWIGISWTRDHYEGNFKWN